MSEPYYAQYSVLRVWVTYFSIGLVVFCLSLTLGVIGLYSWATTVNTCQKRERYSVLTFLEQTVPFVTNPIKHMICPA